METYTLSITENEVQLIRVALKNHTATWLNKADDFGAVGDFEARIAALGVAINATTLGVKVLEATF